MTQRNLPMPHPTTSGGARAWSLTPVATMACAAMVLVAATGAAAAEPVRPMPHGWIEKVRAEHPRMFFNKDNWPQVKAYALEHEADFYARVKRIVAGLPDVPDPKQCESGSTPKYGGHAQRAAFVWLMERDPAALAKAKAYLLEGVRFYNRRSSARRTVNWYSASRVCAMTAYDWIHDQLTPAERREVGLGLLKHYTDCLSGKRFERQNRSDHASGFYGPTNMAWYVGLALYKDGIDDARAARLLRQGYDEHVKLLEYRAQSSGDDGGTGSLAVGYGLGMYPWAEFNFMHTFDSATGLAVEDHFDHLSLFPNWVFWNWLPEDLSWGLADSCPPHKMGSAFLEMHMLQTAHFYARRNPDRAKFALWVRETLLPSREHDDLWWPLAPLMVSRCGDLPEPAGPTGAWPLARNFENMGVVFMRSSWADDAPRAVVVAGGSIRSHRHYDQGHFILYHKGHLAIDSGDYGPREANEHLKEYFYRTVAHNAVLIHAPAEADTAAKVWGGTARTLDGGQCVQEGRQIAFETGPAYSYVATDATRCYDARKCKAATRQFVFVHPDTFVVCDRVVAAKPEYRKAWLLHTVNEPQVADDGKTFRAAAGQGALVCRTVFPEDAALEKIGGPGKEFWSAGKNRAQQRAHRELSGAWRVEVSPGAARAEDVFVHLIRVGDKSMGEIGPVKPIARGRTMGVSFKTSAGDATVLFNTAGPVGGHVTLPGTPGVDRDLATRVQPQSGLTGR